MVFISSTPMSLYKRHFVLRLVITRYFSRIEQLGYWFQMTGEVKISQTELNSSLLNAPFSNCTLTEKSKFACLFSHPVCR